MSVFGPDFLFRNALAGGLLVCVLCAVLGIYVVLRRLALVGVALPQAGVAGVAFAFWLTRHEHEAGASTHGVALAGSVGFTLLALLAVLFTGRRARTPADSRLAALFALSSAFALLFVALNPGGDVEVTSLLRGELLAISDGDLRLLAGAGILTGALFLLYRREILLASFDPEFARSLGRDPARADALLYGLLGLAIGLGVMTVGPLVVFGFLTLPGLAALSVASGLGSAFAWAAGIAAVSSVGGFALAYHTDLPAGPVEVAAAAAVWLVFSAGRRLLSRHGSVTGGRALAPALLLAAGLVGAAGQLGCVATPAGREGAEAVLPRGALPEPDPARPVAVLRFRNETGEALRLPASNPLSELGRAAGDPFAAPGPTVPDALAEVAAVELSRRGYAVLDTAEVRSVAPAAPADRHNAVSVAQRAGLPGPVLFGTLRRWTFTRTDLLLVWLDLELLEPRDGRVLWSGSARRPVPVPAALTRQEIVIDAGPRVFADAFAPR